MMSDNSQELMGLKKRVAELERDLARMESRAGAAEDEIRKCRDEADELRALVANFQAFGLSVADIQSGRKTLAEGTKAAKDPTQKA